MKRTLGLLPLVLSTFGASAPALATSGGAFRHSTPAVSGYDVVSYHTGEKPLRGNGNHVAIHEGVTYLFVNEANREAFELDPARFIPAYGGYCAYGVSLGKKFVADPDVWRIVDGRLYLNLDTAIQEKWNEDVAGRIRKADSRWTEIQDADPASL